MVPIAPAAPAAPTLACDTSLSLDYPKIDEFLKELSTLPKGKDRNLPQYIGAFREKKFYNIDEIFHEADPKEMLCKKIGMAEGDAIFFLVQCKKRCGEIMRDRC